MRITKTDLLKFFIAHQSQLIFIGVALTLAAILALLNLTYLAGTVFFTAALVLINGNIDQRMGGSDDE